jgi:hypothetical protein
MQPCSLIEEDLHYEDWCCLECGATIYGPCHHQSLCRLDFCGQVATTREASTPTVSVA